MNGAVLSGLRPADEVAHRLKVVTTAAGLSN
jgi:hypothetical protein